LECYKKSWIAGAGFEIDTCYDKEAGQLIFKAVIPNNSWFSIGFGPSMTDCDMITWFAENKTGSTKDYWSDSHATPEEDSVNNLVNMIAPVYNSATDKITFITKRALDTGDSSKDFLVQTG
jgi:hypothetical protein